MTTRSLARILPATSLGRIPIFPPMSGCGFLFPHSVYHRRNILRRGLLTTALRSSRLIHEQDTRSQADDLRLNKLPTGGAAPATPLVAQKARRNFNYKPWYPLLSRSRSLRALSAHLVDRDRPRQAQPIPCGHRCVDICVRLCERRVPVCVLPERHCIFRPRARCFRQRSRFRLNPRAVPAREHASAQYRDRGSRVAAYRAAAYIDVRFRRGVP